MSKTIELREKRAGLIKQARDRWEEAGKRESGPTAEDRAEFKRLMDAADTIKDDYTTAERLEAAERDLDSPEPRRSKPLYGRESPEGRIELLDDADDEVSPVTKYRASKSYRRLFRSFLTGNRPMWDIAAHIPAEFRDTILGTDAKGGYLSTPIQLANDIIKLADDFCFVRPLATVVTLGEAKALGVPQMTSRMADANWTTEVAAVTEDTTMAFARRDLTPSLMSKLAKTSIRMLYAATNIESIIVKELGYKNGITEEKAYLTGNGTGQPLGIFQASANGIPAARDVATGNTATAIVADNLFAVKYSIKAPYRNNPSFRWLFSRLAVQNIMLLKDTQNRYLWQPSLQMGTPDMLLNIPVCESEYVPNTFTTGLYVGALGALQYYYIAQVDELQIQRLVELYAATNEIGFISRRYLDGSPVLGEAFARVKLG